MGVEFIDIESIGGVTHDGETISLDVRDVANIERSLTFNPATYGRLLSALLPNSPAATRRVFPLLAATPLQSGSQNRRIRFLLNPNTAIDIEIDPSQVKVLKALLGNVSDQPKRAQ